MESDKLLKNSSLMDAIRYFSDPMVCLETVSKAKWPKGPECPKCGGKKVSFIKTRMLWTCLKCRKQFSVKVGTIFEDSAIPLDKWLVAMWLIANCKNGISSYELSRDVKVTQRSAWFMLHRIRYAMHTGSINKMTGTVEADETFIGGKARFMHKHKRAEKIRDAGRRERLLSLVCWSVRRGRFAPLLFRLAERGLFSLTSGFMLSREHTSTQTP